MSITKLMRISGPALASVTASQQMWLRAVLLQHPVIDIPEQLGGCDVIGIRLSILGFAEDA